MAGRQNKTEAEELSDIGYLRDPSDREHRAVMEQLDVLMQDTKAMDMQHAAMMLVLTLAGCAVLAFIMRSIEVNIWFKAAVLLYISVNLGITAADMFRAAHAKVFYRNAILNREYMVEESREDPRFLPDLFFNEGRGTLGRLVLNVPVWVR